MVKCQWRVQGSLQLPESDLAFITTCPAKSGMEKCAVQPICQFVAKRISVCIC
jgi:hypothetical protein